MARAALLSLLLLAGLGQPAAAREAVMASAPSHVSVTVYRDPNRYEDDSLDRDNPQGFAMISETRQVTLPPGESTIRFEGVAEGMVAVSAIVTGLPGGTIEKNRNADLLSPAALVDGTLGNRVTITRTNPATGVPVSEAAIVRTRADGGLVLQTPEGFEAVRCSGLPEKLTFHEVPAGLSAQPVFSIDTRDATGGTYTVTLTYISWGFDWEAHYVASMDAGAKRGGKVGMKLRSWLTLVNDNGQGFADADLQVIAGELNIASDYESLAEPPTGEPLRLECYPLGSTAAGSPLPPPRLPLAPPPMPMMALSENEIVVTGARMRDQSLAKLPQFMANEEQLGDLKLFRVPEPVTVASKGMKQVAFLDKPKVTGRLVYQASCSYYDTDDDPVPATMRFETVNDKKHGLGAALPMGAVSFFDPGPAGDLFAGERNIRDYAEGQDVEIELQDSAQVFVKCEDMDDPNGKIWARMRATVTNANPEPVNMRLALDDPGRYRVKGLGRTKLKDGRTVYEFTLAANSTRELEWTLYDIDDN